MFLKVDRLQIMTYNTILRKRVIYMQLYIAQYAGALPQDTVRYASRRLG